MVKRKVGYPVLDVIINRHSSRAMSGESIFPAELMSLFEAARWAPSAFNAQPWRFVYATREDKQNWDRFLDLITESNRIWAANGAVLILIVSNKYFEYNNKYSRTHSFDTGAAWENLAIQACSMGLVVHAIEGFNYQKARIELQVPDTFDIECMVIIGKPAPVDSLSEELRIKERLSDRRPIHDIVFKNIFGNLKD